MANTPHLGITLLEQSQAQKEVTVNEAFYRIDALVSFTFNLGGGALQRSTLGRKVNRAEHEAVPAELQKWVFAGGKWLSGLVARRRAEALLYMKLQ